MRTLDIAPPDSPPPDPSWEETVPSWEETVPSWEETVSETELGLPHPWPKVLRALGRTTLRPVQTAALRAGLLEPTPNLIVAAPTNAGKSLVATLALLEAASRGRRAVLLEPLRVLAHEKGDALAARTDALSNVLGVDIRVAVTTGEYRTDHETLFAAPPAGDLVVATPERLDAILRAEEYGPWVEQVGTVVVDEAHLLADPRRGPGLEFLLTTLRARPSPPRLVLLSATLGDTDPLESWLAPAVTVSVTQRPTPLSLCVLELAEDDAPDTAASNWVEDALSLPGSQVVVFVHKTSDAERLAADLQANIPALTGESGALAYHAKLGRDKREQVRHAFLDGRCRVVCATTALGMGVNLPASHVLVRDITFYGADTKTLSAAELAQMMGRAGRGDASGTAAVIVRPADDWDGAALAQALADPAPAPLRSALASASSVPSEAAQVLAPLLLRHPDEGRTPEQLEDFAGASLGGAHLLPHLPEALRWMYQQGAAWTDDTGRVRLTALAEETTRAMLPLTVATGAGRLLRDLLSLGDDDELLGAWRPLDHLLLLDLLSDGNPSVRRYSRALEGIVEAWVEERPDDVPILFRDWMRGGTGHSRAEEVLGSLGVSLSGRGPKRAERARKAAYRAMYRTIVLDARAHGKSLEDVERRFGVALSEGAEERWRDHSIWLLSGLGRLLEIRIVYHHLRNLEASPARVRRVKRALRKMQRQTHVLREQLAYVSPLGPLVRDVRRLDTSTGPSLGPTTLRHLERSGIRSLADLVSLDVDDLVGLGLQARYAHQVRRYVQRRLV